MTEMIMIIAKHTKADRESDWNKLYKQGKLVVELTVVCR